MQRTRVVRLFLPAFALALGLGPPAAHAGEPIAVVGATRIDLSDGGRGTRDAADTVVLIADGRIRAVGRRDEVEIPAGARVIDAGGKYLVPGLIDGFAGMNSAAQARAYLYSGVTTIVGVDGPRRGNLALEARPRPRVERFGMVALDPGPKPADVRGVVRRLVDQLAAQDARVLLLYYTLPPEGVAAAVERARELGLATIGELGETSYEQALAFGVQAFVHTSRYSLPTAPPELRRAVAADPFGPVKLDYYRRLSAAVGASPEADRWAARLGASTTALIPTLAMEYLDLPGHENPWLRPAARILDPAGIHQPADRATGNRPPSTAEPGSAQANADAFPPDLAAALLALERRYAAAGARYLAGSGTSAFGTMPGISLHHELELLVRVGLTPRQALAAATTNYGEAFGWRDLGCLAPGCRGDLLVLAADPTRDLRALDAIDTLIVDGAITDRAALLESRQAAATASAREAAPAEAHADVPGCAILKRTEACSQAADTLADFTACHTAAQAAADAELAAIVERVRAQLGGGGTAPTLAASQSAWKAFADADCRLVAARWAGKPQLDARVAHCATVHALRRAQALWVREINSETGEVPAACLP